MVKDQKTFLDHFARLGIFSKVQALGASPERQDNEEGEPSQEGTLRLNVLLIIVLIFFYDLESTEQQQEDAKEILPGKAYHWKDWSVCRGRDCLYLWSDAAALELSNGSNGWFRFILDGKLATMYSSGSPEGGADTSGEFFFVCSIYAIVLKRAGM